MAYLDDHPPRVRQFRDRGTTPSGVIVVHTAESIMDVIGPDTGAENVAAFIAGRTTYGSYHRLADSDSIVKVVRFDQQAYGDGTGSNPHAIHISAACRADNWPGMSAARRDAFVVNMARAAAEANTWLERVHGITVPARRISREESDRRVPGFISHGERDPGRRTDPGRGFPWADFLNQYEALTQEDDMSQYAEQLDRIEKNQERILEQNRRQLKRLNPGGALRNKLNRLIKQGKATRRDLEELQAELDAAEAQS